ncbi:hypothetical protein A2U01_0077202 [Trifolium medium]|uniref:Uncharacterized protein n=1 Tax=Trifolium medium TaxID=97028 RepID=A0A392T4A5_9FABA|nr:hypothetical protein [Trifolium medium]
MLPLKRKLLHPYTCTVVSHIAQRDLPLDHLFQEDFRYKEPIELFIEPSALIPLLGHEGAARGIIHIGLKNNSTSELDTTL